MTVSGQRSGSLVVWNYSDLGKSYSSGQTINNTHPNGLYSLALSRDLSRIATSGADNTTALWNRQPDNSFSLSQRLQDAANSVDLSPMNQLAVGLMPNNGAITKVYAISANCTQVPNGDGTTTANGTCGCKPGYTWGNGQCTLNCSQVKYAAGPSPTNNGACNCNIGFYWGGSSCNRNCSLVLNSDGINQLSGVCRCMSTFTWNGTECASEPFIAAVPVAAASTDASAPVNC